MQNIYSLSTIVPTYPRPYPRTKLRGAMEFDAFRAFVAARNTLRRGAATGPIPGAGQYGSAFTYGEALRWPEPLVNHPK